MRFLSFGGGLAIGAIVFLIIGGIIGMELGDMNAQIDFCSDNSSKRYIEAAESRKKSCY